MAQLFDLVVIGAGSAGLGVGRRAAQRGAKIAIIEGNPLPFGTCVRAGCVPKKVTWTAANLAESLKHEVPDYGFTGITPSFGYASLVAKRHAYIERLNGIYARNIAKDGITLFKENGTLLDAGSVKLTTSGSVIKGTRVVIATGGHPVIPGWIPGHEAGITSDGFFELTELPKKALVVGAGYIAVELAGIFASFDVDTTLAIRGETFLRHGGFDADAVAAVEAQMTAQESFTLRRSCEVSKVEKDSATGLSTVTFKDGSTMEGVDCIVWAIGRKPNTEGIGLEEVGVEVDQKGYVKVNEYQETNVSNVYALGDVCGNLELTPVAIKAGRALGDRLYGGAEFAKSKMDYTNVPTVVFSHPPLASVGLSEADAKATHGDDNVKVYTSTFTNMYYAMTDHKKKTYMKLVCVGSEEKVVGCHLVGRDVDEMLQGFALALKLGATKAQWDSVCAIHPTGAEEVVTMK